MDTGKLKDSCPYIREVADRLRHVFGDWLNDDESFALMSLIHWNTFEFPDGFILNDPSDINKEIWLADASEIIAAFCPDASKDPAWFKSVYPAHGRDDEAFLSLRGRMLVELKAHARITEGIDQ